jgi:hypothetical protein
MPSRLTEGFNVVSSLMTPLLAGMFGQSKLLAMFRFRRQSYFHLWILQVWNVTNNSKTYFLQKSTGQH